VHDRTGCHRGLPCAVAAFPRPQLGLKPPGGDAAARGADEAIRPTATPETEHSTILTLASIVPLCAMLGHMTPKLIDDYSRGRPAAAGRSYGWNIAGGILGPIVAACLLLPLIGMRFALVILAAPFIGLYIWSAGRSLNQLLRQIVLATIVGLLAGSLLISRSFEDGALYDGPRQVKRDHVATVIAGGSDMNKRLLVNGVGITSLTPITKVMAHLPLALNGNAQNGLVICFGMGTTARAMLSWGIETTAVDLVPSVPELFSFFLPTLRRSSATPHAHRHRRWAALSAAHQPPL